MATWIFILGGFWVLLIALSASARRVDTRPSWPASGPVELANRLYCRVFHGLGVLGTANVRLAMARTPGRALIVVSNHKAGVDGLLVSAGVPFFIRWIMAWDMKMPGLEWAYEFGQLIFVSRESENRDLVGVREALGHLGSGGVLGIFPEGRLCRHIGEIYPFQPGVGLLISRSGALVLPVVLKRSPICENAYASLLTPSRSVIEFMPPIDYASTGLNASAITKDLQQHYERWIGPVNHEPPRATAKG